MKTNTFLILALLFFCIKLQAQSVALTPYATGFTNPIDIHHCGDDRLFVAERNGRIRVVNADGTLRPSPFLDIISKVSGLAGEEGFLGFCFSPDYKTSGKFYVSYTAYDASSQLISVIEQYKVNAADSNTADPTSALRLITTPQPFTNHKGGNIMFGPDNYLYIFWGDGGSGGDPYKNGQNKTVFLAKILRIDVSNSTTAQPYAIPPANPFADSTGAIKKEIWAYGLRNPFRDSFDPITHDLWIADVGQDKWEEIDFAPAGDKGGHNYGWNTTEGLHCYLPAANCDTTGITMPIYNYPHPTGFSIIGGYVYRSAQSRDFWGTYIFGDYVKKWIDGLRQVNGVVKDSVARLLNITTLQGPISFGLDRYNNIYVCLFGTSTIYKLDDANPNPFPKAYFTPSGQPGGNYTLQALEGNNITYQWLSNNAAIAGATNPAYTTNTEGVYQLVVTNSLGNKDTSQPYILSATPVIIKNFAGERIINNQTSLTWQTIAEQNNKGFELERKLDIDTGYIDIAFIPSTALLGNSINAINYSYTDTPVYKGVIQYRLKQISIDGSFVYSNIVTLAAINLKLAVSINPNPANSFINVVTNNNDTYNYQLVDNIGRTILRNTFTGINQQINISLLKTGIYFLKIISAKDKGMVVKKVLVSNK
jgi:glucose/arabinose dehydrogenase